tara:strand:- start:10614 stop:10775 length:162 start_codon:yes stop_codon:yes gene_type:complete
MRDKRYSEKLKREADKQATQRDQNIAGLVNQLNEQPRKTSMYKHHHIFLERSV